MLKLIAVIVLVAGVAWILFSRFKKSGARSGSSLRCSHCGNYYPSMDCFASDGICNSCDARLESRD